MSDLRDPRTFRVVQRQVFVTEGPRKGKLAAEGGGVHFPKDDDVLASIYKRNRRGSSLTPDEQEHYFPGDVIEGRVPIKAAEAWLKSGQLVVAYSKDDPYWTEDPPATEAAREMAAERGIDLADVEGTLRGGRIGVGDVQRHVTEEGDA